MTDTVTVPATQAGDDGPQATTSDTQTASDGRTSFLELVAEEQRRRTGGRSAIDRLSAGQLRKWEIDLRVVLHGGEGAAATALALGIAAAEQGAPDVARKLFTLGVVPAMRDAKAAVEARERGEMKLTEVNKALLVKARLTEALSGRNKAAGLPRRAVASLHDGVGG